MSRYRTLSICSILLSISNKYQKCTTRTDVAASLGRLKRDALPLSPLTMRGANDGKRCLESSLCRRSAHRSIDAGVYGGSAREVALPVFVTVNRGGGFVTLLSVWCAAPPPSAPSLC